MALIDFKDPITAIIGIADKVFDRIFPDPVAAANAKLELFKLQQSGDLAQILAQLEINKIEAANPSKFVSGWRPFIGWVCGFACAWNWIALSIINSAIQIFVQTPIVLKPADLDQMMPVLFALLGLGVMRMQEKIKGVAAV